MTKKNPCFTSNNFSPFIADLKGMRNSLALKPAFLLASVLTLLGFIFIVSFECVAYSPDIQPVPKFVQECKKSVSEGANILLPDKLNGILLKELKGYKDIAQVLESGGELRCRMIAYLLVYDHIRKKLETAAEYRKTSSGEASLDNIFGGKFVVLDPDLLLKDSSYPILDKERESVKKNILELMKILDIERFEKWNIEEKRVEVQRIVNFYSNAVKKTENQLETDYKKFQEFENSSKDAIRTFIRKNIRIEFRIGDTPEFGGVKKNFKNDDPIIVGLKYWTERIEGDVPIEWTISGPSGLLKTGKVTLGGGKSDEYIKLAEDKIPADAKIGIYEVAVTAFPGEGDYRFVESFNIGGVPASITGLYLYGANKKPAKIFKPGDIILLVIFYKPAVKGDEEATFTWNVYDPSGELVQELSTAKNLKLRTSDKEIQNKYIKAKIPVEAQGGEYNFQAKIKMGQTEIKSDIVKFTVVSGLMVKVIPDQKKGKVGKKIRFDSQIGGGTPPYNILWQSESGKTSTSKSIAVIFNSPGKHWISLTVTDSTQPKPLKKTVKVTVDVE